MEIRNLSNEVIEVNLKSIIDQIKSNKSKDEICKDIVPESLVGYLKSLINSVDLICDDMFKSYELKENILSFVHIMCKYYGDLNLSSDIKEEKSIIIMMSYIDDDYNIYINTSDNYIFDRLVKEILVVYIKIMRLK